MAVISGANSGPGPNTGSGSGSDSADSDRKAPTLTPTPPLINLLRGWPAPELLPAAELQTAATRVLTDPALFVPSLEYGADPGYEPLRQEIAVYLDRNFSPSASPSPDTSRICITGGASQNIASVLQSFTDPLATKAVWIAAPCYFLACPIFEDAGFAGRLRAVPEDAEGIDLARLEKGFQEAADKEIPSPPPPPTARPLKPRTRSRRIYRHVVYVVPTASNPSGRSMTLARRTELVRLARRYDALIIADDVYDFLQWPTTTAAATTTDSPDIPLPPSRLPRLVDLDRQLPDDGDGHRRHPFGNVVSNGSFSKLGGPGLRTGWAEATPAFAYGLSQTGCTRSGGAPSQLCASMLAEMMRSGALDRHLRRVVRPALQRRHRLLADAVEALLGEFVVVESVGPEPESGSGSGLGPTFAGYFLWLRLLRPDMLADEVAARARAQENLVVAPGSMFTVQGDEAAVPFDHHLRLCFAYEDERHLVEGVERLARVLRCWDSTASVQAAPVDDGDSFK